MVAQFELVRMPSERRGAEYELLPRARQGGIVTSTRRRSVEEPYTIRFLLSSYMNLVRCELRCDAPPTLSTSQVNQPTTHLSGR